MYARFVIIIILLHIFCFPEWRRLPELVGRLDRRNGRPVQRPYGPAQPHGSESLQRRRLLWPFPGNRHHVVAQCPRPACQNVVPQRTPDRLTRWSQRPLYGDGCYRSFNKNLGCAKTRRPVADLQFAVDSDSSRVFTERNAGGWARECGRSLSVKLLPIIASMNYSFSNL